ncbi:ABC transporter substrate-binding protein [Silvanigrella aquatica]|uniref:Solute-binding protein family 3/N-terminal domain-containing protein n=1 Tax=Silvanigrella aquatica TaxID=1915309 RepID=A0A1L4CY98_9BACT|nr:ABC transporter substrate-binding protein [Silvanigrella aquatica]APJ02910.1 hypothetical protein AXG55_02835 [Silvanigrella aquatica]
MSLKKACLFVLFLLHSNSTFAKNYKEIKVCSEAGFIPFEMRTASGNWDGYDIALIKEFAKKSSRKVKFIDQKFDGLIPSLIASKSCDIVASAVGISEERKKIVNFSEPTYFSGFDGLIHARSSKMFDSFEKINQKNVRIAVQQGTLSSTYVKNVFKNARISEYETNSGPIQAIISDKADIYIDDSVYLSVAVKRNISKFELLGKEKLPENQEDGMAFLFRKSDTELRNQFNEFFNQIKSNGELDKLQNYYFKEMGWMKNFPEN